MKNLYLICALFFLFSITGCATEATTPSATANIVNSQGRQVGTATFTEEETGVHVGLNVSGLPPGTHALHIHETGKCVQPDFKSAGGHFNPEEKQHGKENPNGKHAGDLENIEVNSQGNAKIEQTIPNVTLEKDQKNSLLKADGTAIVIHEKEDDYKSDPAGEAGARIACGVIEEGKE